MSKHIDYTAAIVHECAHAIVDARANRVLKIRDEAAAWLAETIYRFRMGNLRGAMQDDEILRVANRIGERCGLYGNRRVRLEHEDLKPLFLVLRHRYPSLVGLTKSDGIE